MTTLTDDALNRPIAAPRHTEALPRTLITPRVAPAIERRQLWERRYRRRLWFADTFVVVASAGLGAWIQTEMARVTISDAPWEYGRVFLITVAIWLSLLAMFQTRDRRIVGHGTTEYRRAAHATGMAFGILAIGFVLLQSPGIRMQLLVALPLGMAGIVFGRWVCRQWLSDQRARGDYLSRAVVIGSRSEVEYVVRSVHRDPLLGYRVVGVTLDEDRAGSLQVGDETILATGSMHTAAIVAAQLGADAVIVASTPEGDTDFLKQLSWQLEGTAAELVLSSPLADVVSPRMSLKPVEGLPLIHVEIPTFEGGRYLIKRGMDILCSAAALVVVALLIPVIALAIKLEGPGPVFFHQERVGRDGRVFRMHKFRSMKASAEDTRSTLDAINEASGPMFKMKHDPRVTRVGAFLRKFSIDELPQFWNVLVGEMSIVGPRPPLPTEVDAYDGKVYRRLYIKPGITGLWQISGRSDLSWDDTVRLDLRYVENWSVIGDLVIMWRTVGSVIKARGAY